MQNDIEEINPWALVLCLLVLWLSTWAIVLSVPVGIAAYLYAGADTVTALLVTLGLLYAGIHSYSLIRS